MPSKSLAGFARTNEDDSHVGGRDGCRNLGLIRLPGRRIGLHGDGLPRLHPTLSVKASRFCCDPRVGMPVSDLIAHLVEGLTAWRGGKRFPKWTPIATALYEATPSYRGRKRSVPGRAVKIRHSRSIKS
jgi:hypothetical protein